MPYLPHLMLKDSLIDSETDIPDKYREEVMKSVDSEKGQNRDVSITPGKIGQVVFLDHQLSDAFSDEETFYFGHGTPGDLTDINSIFKSGLSVKDPENLMGYGFHLKGLNSTTLGLGQGNEDLFDTMSDLLNNWPHKNSENVIILSFPRQYVFTNYEIRSSFVDPYEQFYIGNNDIGYKIRPEFIRGVYNSVEHSFKYNENFYDNLPDEKKSEFFNELDDSYIEAYAKNVRIPPEKFEGELHLDNPKLDRLSIEWYATQLCRLRDYNKKIESIHEENKEEDTKWIDVDDSDTEKQNWS